MIEQQLGTAHEGYCILLIKPLGDCIWECQTDTINCNFSYKQYSNFKNKGAIDLSGLIKTYPEVAEAIQQCYTNSGQTVLLQVQGFEEEFISNCAKNIQNASEKNL